MRQKKSRLISLAILLSVAGLTNVTFAQSSLGSRQLPASLLRKMKPRTARPGEAFGTTKGGVSTAAATSSLPGVDSVVTWSDQFMTPGFDTNGNPQSVWPYTMVGNPPESGDQTFISSPIVPVTVDLLGPDGKAAFTTHPGDSVIDNVLGSPEFQPFFYTSGIGQFNDQMLRAEFWDRIHRHGSDNGWHNSLVPRLKSGRRMRIPFLTPAGGPAWVVFVDSSGNPVLFAVDETVFGNLLFPTTVPVDNTTPVGAAELAGDITTHDISTFMFNNVVLYDTSIDNCCVIGFHTYDFEPGDKKNGNRERRYVLNYSSWLSPGLFFFGFEDITAWSHELAETFNDPFGDNQTPWWLEVDPFAGFAICQNNLETGDVIEVLTSLPTYSIAMNGLTYHPQNEALFPWFAFESPSPAHLGAYSFPDETTLTALSPSNLLPGCTPAP
jgi:hypothetical protein